MRKLAAVRSSMRSPLVNVGRIYVNNQRNYGYRVCYSVVYRTTEQTLHELSIAVVI